MGAYQFSLDVTKSVLNTVFGGEGEKLQSPLAKTAAYVSVVAFPLFAALFALEGLFDLGARLLNLAPKPIQKREKPQPLQNLPSDFQLREGISLKEQEKTHKAFLEAQNTPPKPPKTHQERMADMAKAYGCA